MRPPTEPIDWTATSPLTSLDRPVTRAERLVDGAVIPPRDVLDRPVTAPAGVLDVLLRPRPDDVAAPLTPSCETVTAVPRRAAASTVPVRRARTSASIL